jgi:hypothetical protein
VPCYKKMNKYDCYKLKTSASKNAFINAKPISLKLPMNNRKKLNISIKNASFS